MYVREHSWNNTFQTFKLARELYDKFSYIHVEYLHPMSPFSDSMENIWFVNMMSALSCLTMQS